MSITYQIYDSFILQARTIENQIDVKLVQLSKLGTGIGSSPSATKASPASTSDKAPLLNGDDDEYEGPRNEIEEQSAPSHKFKVC